MNFVTYNKLVKDCRDFAHNLNNYGCIVGIPRSGLMVASIIALEINSRLGVLTETGIDILEGGGRDLRSPNKILIIDDSYDTGETMDFWRKRFKKYDFAVLYASKPTTDILHYEVVPHPRMFEWNYMNHGLLRECCVDIDGVLNRDIQEGEDNEEFVKSVRPWLIPSYRIHSLVTGRPEVRRKLTEQYLHRCGIKYDKLYMRPNEEITCEAFKAKIYKESNAIFFIESESFQAQRIARRAKKPVLAVDKMKVYDYSR